MSAHWGEMPLVPETDSGIAAIEREQITKPRPMEIEGPRLYQPSGRQLPPRNEVRAADVYQPDPVTRHTIQLLQYARQLRQLIQTAQQQRQDILQKQADDTESPIAALAEVPPIPESTTSLSRQFAAHKKPFSVKKLHRVKKQSVSPAKLDSVSNYKLMRCSVAAVCAHAGYDVCSDSMLDLLTDITEQYIQQMMAQLRMATDAYGGRPPDGFPDIMEAMFHHMGIGSLRTLHSFYEDRVLNYHQNMVRMCEDLQAEYTRLQQPITATNGNATNDISFPVIRIKEEAFGDIEFPSLDDGEDVSAEQVLQLEGLTGLEITVEQESTTGLTTEVETQWQQNVRSEMPEGKMIVEVAEFADPGVTPGEIMPPTPASLSESGESGTDPSSIPVLEIMSPPSIPPAKKKKKK